jgi:hypothetical protein
VLVHLDVDFQVYEVVKSGSVVLEPICEHSKENFCSPGSRQVDSLPYTLWSYRHN